MKATDLPTSTDGDDDDRMTRNVDGRMTRAKFLAASGGALAAGVLAACGSSSSSSSSSSTTASHSAAASEVAKGGTLNLYTWPDYFSTKNLSAYKQQTGTTINISTYDSNDVLFAKLNSAGGSSFDIAIPTSGWILTLANHGLLAKLDHTRIPLQYVSPALLNKVYDPGNVYSIPKDYGVLGVVYDPVAVGGTIKTWQDFLDAGDKPGVSGKVQLSTSAWEVVGIPMWAADEDWNTQDTATINRAGEIMKAWAKNVKEFNGFDTTGPVQGTIALTQCDQSVGRQCLLQNSKLKWVLPGPTAELWVDNYAITAHAPDVNQAYSFINFQLQPAHQVIDTVFIGYPTTLPNLRAKLPANTPETDMIFGGAGVSFDKLQEFVVHPATLQLYENLYTQIQAAAGA
jgi:spermidine/putrescine transport system substrate-binding protein